ncbi:MAG: CDP-alcohol phosphatidyltransferase family protein, partial [Candidatus Rokuibacteriota bacterium]
LYVDPALAATVETDEPEALLAAAAGAPGPRELLMRIGARRPTVERSLDPDGRRALAGPADVANAERWLLRSLIKQNEGFMSRHFERRISLAITRRLAPTRVTPNAMTLVSLAVGLAGALCFVSPTAAWQLTGALLFLAHSILDGCDGELARLRFQESRWGAILDFWGDNLVHLAFFMGVAVGWSREAVAAWPLAIGAVAGLAGLGSATLLAERTMRDEAPGAGAAWTARLQAALANRDFIYAVVALSAFGKAKWFLAMAAIGAPVFLLLSLFTVRTSRGG